MTFLLEKPLFMRFFREVFLREFLNITKTPSSRQNPTQTKLDIDSEIQAPASSKWPFDNPNGGHVFTPEKVTNKIPKSVTGKNLAMITNLDWCLQWSQEKKTAYFPLYWLVNRDPYIGLLYRIFSLLNCWYLFRFKTFQSQFLSDLQSWSL